ncbi:unnamed protein product [Phaeothamnion confervicola]
MRKVRVFWLLCSVAGFTPRQSAAPWRKTGRWALRMSDVPRQRAPRTREPRAIGQQLSSLLEEARELAGDTGVRVGVKRSIQAGRALAITAGEFLLQERRGRGEAKEAAAEDESIRTARALRKLFERLGATYVKVGQFIASSPSLFPAAYVLEMQNCLDQTPPLPFREIQRIIRQELGGAERIATEFLYIDPVPMASASVAQVHRAKLVDGRDVVVKVQKPGVGDVLTADLGFIYVASRVLEIVQPELARTSFSAIVGDIRTSMLDELDFTKEAANLNAFRAFLVAADIRDATAPAVVESLTTKRCLVMERLVGVPLTDLDGIRQFSPDPEATLIAALNTWSMSVVMCESFHADVHAGNLLVLRDGRVGFIDFGIVGRIPPAIWGAMRDLAMALAAESFDGMAAALVAMGAADAEVNVAAFAADIERVYARLRALDPEVVVVATAGARGSGSGVAAAEVRLEQEAVTRLLLDVVAVAEDNGLKLPREFGLLLKQASVVFRPLHEDPGARHGPAARQPRHPARRRAAIRRRLSRGHLDMWSHQAAGAAAVAALAVGVRR